MNGQIDDKRGALARLADDGNLPLMVAHHALHDRQAKPVPCCFVV